MVTYRGTKRHVSGGVSGFVVAFTKIIALCAVCYLWRTDPDHEAKYYLGAIAALAIPIPKRKESQ